MIRLAETLVAARQALGTGRVADAVTGTALEHYSIELGYRIGPESGRFPALLGRRPNGWFVLQLRAADLPADLETATEVEITARITAPGREPADVVHTVPGSHFAITVLDPAAPSGMRVAAFAGPVLDFTVRLNPPAAALRGTVLFENDPRHPAAGATVRAAPLPGATTDAAGRFYIPALPLLRSVELLLEHGTTHATRSVQVDYTRPVNIATLSLPDTTVESHHA
ncbi:hypothetical protein GCM10009715_10560 [Paeniglutamicibacter psychrophenolicus]|uniref:Carboxypeptidase regulatory-like domain-containing protein n=1 Tax=Paeniglutamicibacter psychrophenolicus TaxID=257454 RepID=A0ABS4WG35_9MICC|nr:hypothetical protein [Paeniglutamicibacter psychrophenolicus]MBP2375156.1 hypothetical protein [Paeniglutamicibacter psychrophenolicus]